MSAACCAVPARRWAGAGGSLSGLCLLLVPKCPACIAAYVALFTGAGIAAPVAEYLRPALVCLFAISSIAWTMTWRGH
jgi:hypothetical protein